MVDVSINDYKAINTIITSIKEDQYPTLLFHKRSHKTR